MDLILDLKLTTFCADTVQKKAQQRLYILGATTQEEQVAIGVVIIFYMALNNQVHEDNLES